MRYPVVAKVEQPASSSRWAAVLGILLPLKVLAAAPILLLTLLLTGAQMLEAEYGFWAGLCTGRYPSNTNHLVTDVLRMQTQLAAWIWSYTDAYPPFGLGATAHAVTVEAVERGGIGTQYALWPFRGGVGASGDAVNRWWAVLGILLPLRLLAAIPHYIVLVVLGIVALVLGWISFWCVLFTGRYPRGLWQFNSGLLRWGVRLWGFTLGLTDVYPPFSLA